MSIIHVPYHQDERLAAGNLPLPADAEVVPVLAELPEGDLWARLAALHGHVAEAVAQQVRTAAAATVISGDCLVSLGVLAGVQRAGIDPSIIWFDAHGDVHTTSSSTSGYPGGMALRQLLGADPELIAGPLGLRALTEGQVALVGARDLDPAEIDYLATASIHRREVDEVDPETLPPGPLLLHVDLDVIDSDDLPGMRFPVADGPSSTSVLAAARRILLERHVVALDIACPWHDGNADDVERRADLLAALTTPS